VHHVARHQAGGLRYHDLRHSYATWLVDDGVPPNMVQRVMGHERSTTTLDLYTRRTDNGDRIREALTDPDDEDPDDEDPDEGSTAVGAPKWGECSGNAPAPVLIMTNGLVLRLAVSLSPGRLCVGDTGIEPVTSSV
jgi:hypothetical protein